MLISRNIRLDSLDEAVDFVNEMSKCPYVVKLSKNYDSVNAKSILGVVALGIGEDVRVDIYTENTYERFEEPALILKK